MGQEEKNEGKKQEQINEWENFKALTKNVSIYINVYQHFYLFFLQMSEIKEGQIWGGNTERKKLLIGRLL